MPHLTIIFGYILVALGIVGYLMADGASKTALIPTYFGFPLVILGRLALSPRFRKHSMHGAVVIALLGFLGSARGLMKLPALLSGGEVERPLAVGVQSAMAVICLVYIVLAVQSFIAARRARV